MEVWHSNLAMTWDFAEFTRFLIQGVGEKSDVFEYCDIKFWTLRPHNTPPSQTLLLNPIYVHTPLSNRSTKGLVLVKQNRPGLTGQVQTRRERYSKYS